MNSSTKFQSLQLPPRTEISMTEGDDHTLHITYRKRYAIYEEIELFHSTERFLQILMLILNCIKVEHHHSQERD